MGVYKQIRSLSSPVLSDIDEDNFDRAFEIIRPVIQGTADVGGSLTEKEVVKTMDFCKNLFAPTDPSMHGSVCARVDEQLFSLKGPILTPEAVDAIFGKDEDAIHVIKEVNARKAIHPMYMPVSDFEHEVISGLKARCLRGSLGLVQA